MLFLPLAAAALVANEFQAAEAQSDLNFKVEAVALARNDSAEGDEQVVDIKWQRIPQGSDFPNIDRKRLSHEAIFTARCELASGGRLKKCEIVEERPTAPELRPIFLKALDLLVMQQSSAKQVEGTPSVLVSLLMSNPGGTNSDTSYCGGLFCVPSPPPPPPPRPSPERS